MSMNPNPVIDFKSTKLHEWSSKLIGPIAEWLARLGIDPNYFTWLSVVFAACAGVALWHGRWLAAGVLLLANGFCDVADGVLAREMKKRNQRSERLRQMGAFLDPAVDRINDGFLFIGLIGYGFVYMIAHPPTDLTWYSLFFMLLLAAAIAHPISSYYRARIESLNMRFQEKKPLTRAGLHLALAAVIIGMLLLPDEARWWYYLAGTTFFVSASTLVNLIRRFRRSLKLFDQFRGQ